MQLIFIVGCFSRRTDVKQKKKEKGKEKQSNKSVKKKCGKNESTSIPC